MRGIIFKAFASFIESNFDYETLDILLLKRDYPNKGGFSAAGNYDVGYLISLMEDSVHLCKRPKEKVLEEFGRYTFKFLLDSVKELYSTANTPLHSKNAYDFLENLNVIHFDELLKLYPDANFPKFDIQRTNSEIIIDYSSPLNVPHIVLGLIEGCLDYYSDDSMIETTFNHSSKNIDGKKHPIHRFKVKNNG